MEIMIVDDEPQVAEVLATSLKRQGHSTTVVHSVREALDRLKSVAFDAMFLDVSMPGMNGLDVMAEVRRLRPSLAVVVITGHATPEEIEDVKKLGAVDVIQTPSALTHYHQAIERLNAGYNFTSELYLRDPTRDNTFNHQNFTLDTMWRATEQLTLTLTDGFTA